MVRYSIIPAKGEGNTFIRATETSFDELGIGSTNTGFLTVQAEKAEALLEKFEAGELGVNFGEKNAQGLYDLEVVRAEELVTNS